MTSNRWSGTIVVRLGRGAMLIVAALCFCGMSCWAQTGGTGALGGVVTDANGGTVAGATVKLTSEATGESRKVETQDDGAFLFSLLLPGEYRIEASKSGFKTLLRTGLKVNVAETATANLRLQVGEVTEKVVIHAEEEILQTRDASLGRTVERHTVESLPLVSRNYTQIIGLSAGTAAGLNNAGSLGRGDGGLSGGTTGFSVHGAATNDNNYQMNGIGVNDRMGSGTLSSGTPIPNPDAIMEFKVQTGQNDASYGRNAGATVNVVTKSGTNEFHGTVFEFLRNDALNANLFFLNKNGQPRAVLKQNQFGFTLGGPIIKDRLHFFTSYQGTRQRNGVASGCAATITLPALTDDRSPAALGALFGGRSGTFGGTAVAANGSNIAPQALALLQMKLPNGKYLIPTPQTVNPALGFDVRGSATFSVPCQFSEDQAVGNLDFTQSEKSRFTGRFFWANGTQNSSLPGTNLGGPPVPGFPQLLLSKFRVVSLTHNYSFTPNLINQITLGYYRSHSQFSQQEQFSYSDIGVNAPSFDNPFPAIQIGAVTSPFVIGGNGQGADIAQNFYNLEDSVSYVHGRHSLRAGGEVVWEQVNFPKFHFFGGLLFASFPDFLLGLSAAQNGSPFSNILASIDVPALFDRSWRSWNDAVYIQDGIRVTSRLYVTVGFRYQRLGAIGDDLGRMSIFDPARANPTPPAGGTLQGYVVASNFSGTLPAGVIRAGNNSAFNQEGQNNWQPRIGFAWNLPGTNRFVLRGGYGIYNSTTTAQPILQLATAAPFGLVRQLVLGANAAATWANPFQPPPTLPSFTPYSPTTALSIVTIAPDYRPAIIQHYSLNLQTELVHNLMLEVGYAGARGTHLSEVRLFNQAGNTGTITFANTNTRVPVPGFSVPVSTQIGSGGSSWYNALTTSLTKRFSHGLQFLASYTWAKSLATDASFAIGPNGGSALGNQNVPSQRYGQDSFVRRHRLVFSYVYDLPQPKDRFSVAGRFLGGWSVSGVTAFQSGQWLTITETNSQNAFGITGSGQDRAQFVASCSAATLVKSGSVNSKINGYFIPSCFTAPPVIGSDNRATNFGNSGVGIVTGPDQRNTDIAIIKRTPLLKRWESGNLEFRTEFFNAFNTTQFSNPNTNAGTVNFVGGNVVFSPSAAFGLITGTSVSPRIIQFALKLNF